MLELNQLYNMDCMVGMKEFPDKFFELAIVDPPYGIDVSGSMGKRAGYGEKVKHKPVRWDKDSPDETYFKELFRVSQNQIIWGANHFISKIPYDTPCWICWDKMFSENVSFASFELAWTSFKSPSKRLAISPMDEYGGHLRIHPTQKPEKLYKWLLTNYAKPGDKILDTHAGSASSLVACYDLGFDYIGFEIDPDYFKAACRRIEETKAQIRMII